MALRSQGRTGGIGPAEALEHGRHGGLFATILSAVALIFSGISYYESAMKSADLAVYVPPMIHYARDGGDVFNIPITIANDGARTGTVLAMELEVQNLQPGAERKSAKFHSAFLGDYPRDDKTPLRSFAPLSIPGHGTFTETVRFYNMGEQLPMVVDDKGDFRFTLKLTTVKAGSGMLDSLMGTETQPLTFDLNLPYLSVQHLAFRNGTISMYNKDWKPAVSTSTEPAVSRKMPESKSGEQETATPDAKSGKN
jgi:hypothetical protein